MANKAEERILAFISPEPNTGCWLWLGSVHQAGYGHFRFRKLVQRAHRAAYMIFVGEIPAGMELDHLCRNPSCVNPKHLEPITHAENLRRWGATHSCCPSGHLYTEDNLYYEPDGSRSCRQCGSNRKRNYKIRQREKLLAV